jgi:NTE family protein
VQIYFTEAATIALSKETITMAISRSLTVALSGGGVAGLGHIPVLAALDELGVRPAAISGTSMGAVIAASYAAGMTAAEIEAHVLSIARSPLSYTRRYLSNDWQGLISASLNPEPIVNTIAPEVWPENVSDLAIPTTIVATDFHRREAVTFRAGNLHKAVAASIAIPGVFRPLKWNGRVLVDGGVCNNLPVDVLPPSDYTLAVDVASEPPSESNAIPGTVNIVTSSVRIMLHALTTLQIQQRENVIFVQPESRALGPLDLSRLEEAINMSRPQTEIVKRRLALLFD